ncbi:MAG: SUMF1/EgtB/PvdO family nonheme iron enzyme [Candidatus Saganbacteria bacterium]|nr:SUMF1/EgtB/PvdO family nonheme iron enzyme [Candidatus Saganbacteria bacterium]
MLNSKLISFEINEIMEKVPSFEDVLSDPASAERIRLSGVPIARVLVKRAIDRDEATDLIRRFMPFDTKEIPEIEMVRFSPKIFLVGNEDETYRVNLDPFSIAASLVTNLQYAGFVEAGGYQDFDNYWSVDGIVWREKNSIQKPTYGYGDPSKPIKGLSYFEAEAYLAWAGFRFPTAHEWLYVRKEIGLRQLGKSGPEFVSDWSHSPEYYRILGEEADENQRQRDEIADHVASVGVDLRNPNANVIENPKGPAEGTKRMAVEGAIKTTGGKCIIRNSQSFGPAVRDSLIVLRAAKSDKEDI